MAIESQIQKRIIATTSSPSITTKKREKPKGSGKRAIEQNRRCLLCNSDKTNIGSKHPVTGKNYARWHKYEHGFICNTCKFRLRYRETQQRGKELLCLMM